MKIGADCVISSSRTALHVGALFLRNRHPSNASSLRLSPRGLTTLRGPRSSIRQHAGVLFLVIIRFSRRRKWRPRKREAAGRLAPINATRNVGRYFARKSRMCSCQSKVPSFNKDTHAFRQRKSALTASSSLTYASMPASSSLSSSGFPSPKSPAEFLRGRNGARGSAER